MTQLPAKEFKARRKILMDLIGNDSIAIVPSSHIQIRNRDAEHPFRQDSDFLYLTGFYEPDSLAVFVPGREESEYIIFCREKDTKTEQWTGRMQGIDGVIENFNADDAFPLDVMDEIVPSLMENRSKVYYSVGNNPDFDKQVISWVNSLRTKVRSGLQAPHEFISLNLFLHELRLFKSHREIDVMREAAEVSVRAHERAMKACKPNMMEYEIDAEYQYEFRKSGMVPAYTTIVGGGENSCILHYIDNNQELKDGDLLLIDAGAENQGYASDISRSFPVNGTFSEAQRQLYQIVLDAQYAAIEAAVPGNTWIDPHNEAVRVITTGLVELGILDGNIDKLIEDGKYTQFYMHKTGHWLGLDVHDVGEYKKDDEWRKLETGMVLTIEPGLYISPDANVDEKWWNIGIRIEDDILITEHGNEVLTQALIKEIDDIEAMMASGS